MSNDNEQREHLARDVFLVDNSNAPEDMMLAEWERLTHHRRAYAYNIAEGLLAKGYTKTTTEATQ